LLGEPFKLLKFRSMRSESGTGPTTPDAERLTPFGRFLRSTSLDELPELWHVIRGDMSLVGPRPLLPEYLPLYNAEQARRLEVRPGITGWAQVHGRNGVAWEERFDLDRWYIDHASPLVDLRILALTPGAVLLRRGITPPGQAGMQRFRGNV
jgi:lipopolysaccharide/colanic/teichoic acid biosynthesis glycosyltransferase